MWSHYYTAETKQQWKNKILKEQHLQKCNTIASVGKGLAPVFLGCQNRPFRRLSLKWWNNGKLKKRFELAVILKN